MAIAEHGSFDTWDWVDRYMQPEEKDAFVKKYFLPYLNVLKFCPTSQSPKNCFSDTEVKLLNATSANKVFSSSNAPQVLLADGVSIEFFFLQSCFTNKSRCMTIYFDVNGYKKPSTIGYDLFALEIFPQTSEILPVGMVPLQGNVYDEETKTLQKRTWEELLSRCKNKDDGGSWACTARVIGEGFKINY